MKPQCCDKCRDVYFEKDYPMHTAINYCANSLCECHKVLVTSPTEPIEKQLVNHPNGKCKPEDECPYCNTDLPLVEPVGHPVFNWHLNGHDAPTEPVTEDWAIEFDNRFGKVILATDTDEFTEHPYNQDDIKAFIRQTRLDLLNEIEGEISSKEREILNKIDAEDNRNWKVNRNRDIGFNQGLQVGVDIINKHKK